MGVPFLPARSDKAADSFWDVAAPGLLFSAEFGEAIIPVNEDARDKLYGLWFCQLTQALS